MTATTAGLVCAHHHLYSTLARGMPPPPATPHSFPEILEQVWWRLDLALDLDLVRWSALLGAVEALEAGTAASTSSPTPAPRLACGWCAPTR
jgi:cytosine/adenosine deaminase-related metal-dependent hydrolase